MKTLIFIMMLIVTGTAEAKQVWNGYEGRHETAPDDNQNWQPQFNPYTGTYSVQPDNAKIEFNATQNKYEWDSGNNSYPENERWGW